MRSCLPAVCLVAAVWTLTGCGAGERISRLIGPSVTSTSAAHVVLVVQEGCRTGIAQTHRGGTLLFTVPGDTPRELTPGDILEGPEREGESVFLLHPPETTHGWEGDAQAFPMVVEGLNLSFSEARTEMGRRCSDAPTAS